MGLRGTAAGLKGVGSGGGTGVLGSPAARLAQPGGSPLAALWLALLIKFLD